MRLFGDLCSNWISKKSAILFGCVELCVSGLFLEKPLRLARRSSERLFVWIVLSVLCLGIFVVYVYGILKVFSKNLWWDSLKMHILPQELHPANRF